MMGDLDWVYLDQKRNNWRAYMNLWFFRKCIDALDWLSNY